MIVPQWVLDDSPIDDPFGFGERAVQWLRKLKHPKNPAYGHSFQMDRWLERVIRGLYGPRNEDGTRKVRRLVLLLPRGNRKTSACAAITLLHLVGPEALPGGLIVSAASAHEQAMELFNEAALIINHDKRLYRHLTITESRSTITFGRDRSRYKAVASDGKTQHGKTPNVVIADELHAWEGKAGRAQWEALDSALVKIPNTLMVVASTSGKGQENLAWQTVEYAIKVQKGEIDDPATLPVIFMAEEGDDWQDEAVWHALNPGMAHGYPDLASFRDKALKAVNSPSDRASFLQYNLNRWLDYSTAPFVEMSVYDKGNAPVGLGDVEANQAPVWMAVDLSTNIDLTAIVMAWGDPDDGFQAHAHFFCPEDKLERRAADDDVPYPQWAEDGLITPTPGDVIDYRAVEKYITSLCATYNVQEIAFDPSRAKVMIANLLETGLPAIEFPQTTMVMAPAVKELERAIIGKKFRHGGNPILRWHFENIHVGRDRNDNIFFHKGKSRDRIDGAVAAAMAVARCAAGNSNRSSYDDAGDDFESWAYA